jgi:hypothetical protein
MSRTTWAALLVVFGLISLAIPLIGYSLPPCFGRVPDGQISAECMAEWQAAMPLFPERFVYVLGVPGSVVVSFLALTAIALVVDVARRSRQRSSREIARPD